MTESLQTYHNLLSHYNFSLLNLYTYVCLQNPLGQLKDLVELKDQLEDIQRRVEDEIQAGVPPVRLEPEIIIMLMLRCQNANVSFTP